MLKRWQVKNFNYLLKCTFDEIEGVEYTDDEIIYDGFSIKYRIVNQDIFSNYSSMNNIIFINPKDVKNHIRLHILIKQALRYRKKNIPWL